MNGSLTGSRKVAMNQTSVIGGSLIFAFVIFVIVRGELPCYLQILGIATDAQCPKGTVSTSGLGQQIVPAATPISQGGTGLGIFGTNNPAGFGSVGSGNAFGVN